MKRSQKLEVRGQKSEVRGQKLEFSLSVGVQRISHVFVTGFLLGGVLLDGTAFAQENSLNMDSDLQNFIVEDSLDLTSVVIEDNPKLEERSTSFSLHKLPKSSPTPNAQLPISQSFSTPNSALPTPNSPILQISPVGNPRIPADKRSIVTLEGTITDAEGDLIRQDTIVTLTASAGTFVGIDYDEDQPGFQVLATEGEFSAQLQSSLDSQKVRIRAAVTEFTVDEVQGETEDCLLLVEECSLTTDLEAYTQVEFITNLRPSLVSGVVNLRIGNEGTDFFGSRAAFLDPDNLDEGVEANLDIALFATGAIGEWLFTGAYNNSRALNQACDGDTRLFRNTDDCDEIYPVYGDSSTIDHVAPSSDSVFVRLERTSPVEGAEADYVMWGDYYTRELNRPSQLFTATNRALHGFKGNFNFGNLQLSALYSPDAEGFQRDAIAPDGTSGYYFLSRRLVVPGSETIYIETEELNRPGTVLKRQQMNRGPDYEIDYDRGTILFRRPIYQTDFADFGETLVNRIVVSYQYEGDGDDTNIYGGRLQYNFSQEYASRSWAGISYFQENQGGNDFELYGADFLVPLGKGGRIIGEYAHSNHTSVFSGDVSGDAYRLEVNGNLAQNIVAKAYYTSTDQNFNNNATVSFTPGQTRTGALVNARVGPTTSVQVAYDYEENFGVAPATRTTFNDLFSPGEEAIPGSRVDNELSTIRAGVQQQLGTANLSLEYVNRSRSDNISGIFDEDSSQIVSRLFLPLSQTVALRAQNETTFGDDDPLYPSRTTLGVDWAISPDVTMRFAHQFFDGGILEDNSITRLETLSQQRWGENTTLTNRYTISNGINGATAQSSLGLNHRWVVSPGFRINLGYERVDNDILEDTAAGNRFEQPFAVGQSASSLGVVSSDSYSVGMEYTANPDFKISTRFEHRNSSGGDNTVFSIAAAGKINKELTGLLRYQQASSANQLLEGLGDTRSLRVGLAYRDPDEDRFNGLLRYEFRQNPETIPDTLLLGSGTGSTDHVLSTELIFAPDWRWEFYGKFALRYSSTDIADDFVNDSTIYLGQLRTTYRIGYRMDVAAEARLIGQPEANFTEWGWAIEGGYYLSPDFRIGLGYSFGSVDDRDFSGFRSEGGLYLNLTLKVNELFGGFGRQ